MDCTKLGVFLSGLSQSLALTEVARAFGVGRNDVLLLYATGINLTLS